MVLGNYFYGQQAGTGLYIHPIFYSKANSAKLPLLTVFRTCKFVRRSLLCVTAAISNWQLAYFRFRRSQVFGL